MKGENLDLVFEDSGVSPDHFLDPDRDWVKQIIEKMK
jgi:hypothetical protein